MAVTQAQVAQLYVALFNRAPEGAGFNAWVSAGATKTQAQIANDMLNSDAAIAYYGGSIDQDRDFVEMVYKNILGKDYSQDPDGINAWVKHLQLGNSRGDMLVKLFDVATSAIAKAADPVAAKVFENKTEISKYMAEKISNISQNGTGDYNYTPFQEIIRTTNSTNLAEQKVKVDEMANADFHTLTTSADTVNGTAKTDVIKAVASSVFSENTLNPEDKIDGGAGNDTLSVTMNTNFNGFTTGELKNVENLNLINNGGALKEFNANGVTGLKSAKLDGNNAVRVINLANIIDFSVADLKNDYITLTYQSGTVSGNTDEQNLTLDNVGASTPVGMLSNSISTTFSGIETLNIKTQGRASYIKNVNTENVKVSGDASLDVAVAANTKSFDASGLKAKLVANLVNSKSVLENIKGGSADDRIKADIDASTIGVLRVDGGNGYDTLEFDNLTGGLDTARKLVTASVEHLIFKNATVANTAVPAVIDLERSPDVTKLTIGLKDTQASDTKVNIINSKVDTLDYITNTKSGNLVTIDSVALKTINYVNDNPYDTQLGSISAAEATSLNVNLKGIMSGNAKVTANKATYINLNIDSLDVVSKGLSFEAEKATTMKIVSVQKDSVFKANDNNMKALQNLDIATAGRFDFTGDPEKLESLSTINLKGTSEKSSATVVAGTALSIQDINLTADHLQATMEKQGYQSLNATLNTQGTINAFLNNNTQGEVKFDIEHAGSVNIVNNSVNIQKFILVGGGNAETFVKNSFVIKGGTAHQTVLGNIYADKMNVDFGQTLGLTDLQGILTANDITLKISQITGANGNIQVAMAGARNFKADIEGSVKGDKLDISYSNHATLNTVENIKVSGDLGAGYDIYSLNTANTTNTVRTIDLSGLKNVEKGTIALDNSNTNLLSLKATSGDDKVTLIDNMLIGNVANNVDIDLGAGDDEIITKDLVANKTVTINGGAGNDLFDVRGSKTDVDASKYVVIGDVSGGDKIKFDALVQASGFERIQDNVVKDATTLKEAINLAIESNQSASPILNKVFYFTYAGDTYVVHNATSTAVGTPDTLTAADTVVKLAGVRSDDLILTADYTEGTLNIN